MESQGLAKQIRGNQVIAPQTPIGSDEQGLVAFVNRIKSPPLNRRGQPLRSDGIKTRLRILTETLRLLRECPFADVTMANVCKGLGLNAAAFYRYFADIGEVIIVLHEVVQEDFVEIIHSLDEDWVEDRAYDQILAFLDKYFEMWCRHAALLLARNSLAEARDERFMDSRRIFTQPANRVFAEKMAKARAGITFEDARARASLLMMALERAVTLAVTDMYGYRRLWPQTRIALAEMILSLSRQASSNAWPQPGRGSLA